MTIEEIRKFREQTELEIMQKLERFKEATGLVVVGCEVCTVRMQTAGQATPNVFVTGVSLTVESI